MTDIKGYFPMIKHFWQVCRRMSLTPSEIALFLALVDEANENFWASNFYVSNGWLTAKIGVSEPTLISARNKLGQYNLIRFKSGKSKRKPTQYSILFLENYSNNLSENLSREQENKGDNLNNFSESFSKPFSQCLRPNNNTNTNTTLNTNTPLTPQGERDPVFENENFENEISETQNFENPMAEEISESPVETENASPKKVALKKGSQKAESEKPKSKPKRKTKQQQWDAEIDLLTLPHHSVAFQENWLGFREVRKEMKKPITPTAAKMIFKKLERFSADVATKALEASATNGWQGVFPENILREQSYTAPKKTIVPPKFDLRNADYTL